MMMMIMLSLFTEEGFGSRLIMKRDCKCVAMVVMRSVLTKMVSQVACLHTRFTVWIMSASFSLYDISNLQKDNMRFH